MFPVSTSDEIKTNDSVSKMLLYAFKFIQTMLLCNTEFNYPDLE